MDHTCVRSNCYLAGSECVKRIYGLVWRNVVRQMDKDVRCRAGKVVDLLDLDLSALLGLHDGLLYGVRGLAERNLCDRQCILIDLLDLRAYLYLTSLLLAAVLRAVCISSCKEVREDLEVLSFKNGYRCVDELVEVVRQNLRCESGTDTFSTLSEQDRELHRKLDWLLVATVV